MAKKAEIPRNQGYVDDLSSYISSTQMFLSYQQPRRNSRLFAYSDILSVACRECFRWCDGSIYVFDGRIWVPCSFEDFKYIVRDAFVKSAGVGSEVVKGDWIDKEKKLVEYALDGVKRSLLFRSPSIVGFVNGVWDFGDVGHPVKHSFSERMPITSILPFSYSPSAVCPIWRGFLSSMLSARDIRVLQKFFALYFVDRTEHSVESSLWLIGSGANGKSTIERMFPLLFGESSVSYARLDSLMDRNIVTRLLVMDKINGCRFNICEEISDVDVERGSDVFKSLVSGQPQQARGIGHDIYDACDIPFMVFTMNQLPRNRRMDAAFRRRMVRIYFRSSVRKEDMDTNLVGKLSGELSGIFNWVIDGYRLLAADSYVFGEERGDVLTDDDIDMMIGNGQTADAWVLYAGLWPSRHVGHESEEACVVIPMQVLYKDYESYCRNLQMTVADGINQFGKDLRRLGFECRRRAGGSAYVVYCDKRNKFFTNNS